MSSPPSFVLPDARDLTFADTHATLHGLLVDDLRAGVHPVPTLLAFRGDDAVAIAGLRPVDGDELPQALIEVLALLLPLGADRIGFGAAGRVWSTDDPIVPVCEEGDLRQRALMVTAVDGHDGEPTLTATVTPVEGSGHDLTLLPPVSSPGTRTEDHEGRVAGLLVAAVRSTPELVDRASPDDLIGQLGRLLVLGHHIALAPDTLDALAVASAS